MYPIFSGEYIYFALLSLVLLRVYLRAFTRKGVGITTSLYYNVCNTVATIQQTARLP